MKFVKWIAISCIWIHSAYAVKIRKEGLIPSYRPDKLKIILCFVPYNTTVIIVGDRIADFASAFARKKECANVYGFTAGDHDFKRLDDFGRQFPNIKPRFGQLNNIRDGSQLFYSTLAHDIPEEFYYHFSGSLLKPKDVRRPFLFGPSYQIPTFNFLAFCKQQKLSKIHVIRLDCGGNELRILKSIQKYLRDAVVVLLKTYHQEIREGINQFPQVHEFMTKQGYELLSHYIYDNVIGDALYVKSKYVSAVFRSKEL